MFLLEILGMLCGLAFGLVFAALVLGVPLLIGYARYRSLTNGHPGHWLRALLGRGMGVPELARRMGIGESELLAFRPQYREVRIPKRSGGLRTLHVPDDATKALQRRILRRVLGRLRVHPSATAYERGRSVVDNARPHSGRAVVIRMDVRDFFPSTSSARIEAWFRRIGWDRAAAARLTELTTWQGGLPQGAPTSPRLANLVNARLDLWMERLAASRKGAYTRYADDLTFSFPEDYPKKMRGIVQKASRILRRFGYRAHRRRKLSIRRGHQRQMVTGLIVNGESPRLPRETRRWLRAVEHRLATGGPASLDPAQLAGWRSYRQMVEGSKARPGATPPGT